MLLNISSSLEKNNTIYKPNFYLFAAIVCSAIIAGCASRSDTAPVTDYTNSGNSGAVLVNSSGATYVVKPGDTLYSIARGNNMPVTELASLNNINDSTQISVGQVLRLNNQTQLASNNQSSAASAAAVSMQDQNQSGDKSQQSSSKTQDQSATSTNSTDNTASQVKPAADSKLIDWAWPMQGNIIQGFNASTKGIDIEGAIGDTVKAAADGKVMYSGNGVRGLGNLLLVMHDDGYISAYAHNQDLLVKKDATVKKGQKIATVGQSDTSSPRLHFEIRRRGTPVNPLSYLPKS